MNFDFKTPVNRKGTHSYKWDVEDHELPMWVADMDFKTAPAITQAILNRTHQDAFGYNIVPQSFYDSVAKWWKKRHHWDIDPKWVMFCSGVVPAISSIVRKMTQPQEHVIVLSPVYNIFYNSIINNNRIVVESKLNYQNETYSINFEDLEAKLSDPKSTLLIFCNPHNPIGKVWDKETLKKVGDLCIKHKVLIISDEIHCDLTHPEYTYTPMASISHDISQNTITCISPTKTFNLAGLQTSAIVVANETVRKQVHRGINTDEVAEPNTFAIQACEAAFNHGEPWLNELLMILQENRETLTQAITSAFSELKIIQSEATYLAWLDCSNITDDTQALCDYIRKETGLYLSAGHIFGGNGDQFIRWNYACPKTILEDGISRFIKALTHYQSNHT
ncbi:hypothetical protein AOC36_06405 [Erysipelothrix larvae]|uniref:cysteine-S-conjugate beta-lyase n=1 Tax=Erysipelothrix larvae TaxID=1514105 RepID=A0A0X8H0H9_9FIRM|nr:MalY/PatB family protein [Erysipelothrix larvae]AMC93629.1 hypothetical protein AOC36_06405 [Erysipelothrix larvae]